MSETLHIGLIGDYNPQVRAHQAIPRALELAASSLGLSLQADWHATDALEGRVEELLSGYDALWCVPASPYASMDGALQAIRFAREKQLPFLGTCGGCQHAILEFARNVLGIAEADHAETNPDAELLFVTPLVCSLVGVSDIITFKPESRIAAIYGKNEIIEQYHCSYGPAAQYYALLERNGLRITGLDKNGEARSFELDGHPFFICTLFQPELSALSGTNEAHPLITAYVQATSGVRLHR